ncbi:hypothetical protein Y025_4518 [Burkholderia pseudomallei TSV32]|nr:hypothetical protein Y025_4518 [Burkholderia pseudomallei TSV32]
MRGRSAGSLTAGPPAAQAGPAPEAEAEPIRFSFEGRPNRHGSAAPRRLRARARYSSDQIERQDARRTARAPSPTSAFPLREFFPTLYRRPAPPRREPRRRALPPFNRVTLLSHEVHRLSHYCHEQPLIFAVP